MRAIELGELTTVEGGNSAAECLSAIKQWTAADSCCGGVDVSAKYEQTTLNGPLRVQDIMTSKGCQVKDLI
jgi:hypothetical protein